MMMPPRAPLALRTRIVKAFTERLSLKASAVLLAVAMWFVVAAREPMEDVAAVRFAPQLDSALVLRDPAPPIRAQVLGRPNEILKLAQTPLVIRKQVASDVPDTLVIPLRTSDVEVPDGVELIVRDVYPHSLTLHFEPTAMRDVPVHAAILVQVLPGMQTPSVRLDPESVTVRGPRRAVARVNFVQTVADSMPVDTLPHLVDLDTAGLGVTVRPTQVKVMFSRAASRQAAAPPRSRTAP